MRVLCLGGSESGLTAVGTGTGPALALAKLGATVLSAGPPAELIASATHLHLCAPGGLARAEAATLLCAAREQGVTTSADLLGPGERAEGVLDAIAPSLEHLDVLLPGEEWALALTGAAEVTAAGALLQARGVGVVAVMAGPAAAIVIDARGVTRVPALPVHVVDVAGCGDAFTAGFLRGLSLGRSHADAARMGAATAACVAQGPGGDFGDYDLALVEGLAYS